MDTPKLIAFRNCFEAGMDFETALGCAGLSHHKPEVLFILHRAWMKWETRAEG
jgi:hypothetical protein